jgi:L-ascorbate metabolism protein UlaG (beta-lactamase superfamily)
MDARLTYVGHATAVIELGGVRLLTDPVLRPRIAHLRRVAPPPSALEAVHAVLVSHVHYDHLDLRSLRLLPPEVPVIAPHGTAALLHGRQARTVVELEEGEATTIGGVTVRATHAEHAAARRSLGPAVPALGFLVTGPPTIYFAGDTDLFDGMRGLAAGLDVALLPVWGWGPRLPPGHLDPERAARALQLLRPRLAVPIHWGTYRALGTAAIDPPSRPADEFRSHAAELAPDVEVRVLEPGESLRL